MMAFLSSKDLFSLPNKNRNKIVTNKNYMRYFINTYLILPQCTFQGDPNTFLCGDHFLSHLKIKKLILTIYKPKI